MIVIPYSLLINYSRKFYKKIEKIIKIINYIFIKKI